MRITIPGMRIPSIANTRMGWRRMIRLKKMQRDVVQLYLLKATTMERAPAPPIVVTLTRVGPKKLDDDNLASAFKYIRDRIAQFIGLDDGSPLYTWRYEQEAGEYGVRIEMVERGDGV